MAIFTPETCMKIIYKGNRNLFIATGTIVAAVLIFGAVGLLPKKTYASTIGAQASLSGGVSGSYGNLLTYNGSNIWSLNSDSSLTKWGHYGPIITYPSSTAGMSVTTTASISAIASDSSGNLWLAEQVNVSGSSHGHIVKVSPSGTVLAALDLGGTETPYGAVVDSSGNLWTENRDSYVSEVSATGTLIGTYNVSASQLQNITSDGTHAWVSGGNTIEEVSSTGTVLATVTLPSSYYDIFGIAFDGTNIWATYQSFQTSTDNGVVVISPSSGTVIATYPGSGGITNITSIGFDGTNMWISYGAGVARISPTGTYTLYPGDNGGSTQTNNNQTFAYNAGDKTMWTSARYGATYVMQTTATVPSVSSLSALSGSYPLSPSFSSATTSYAMSVLENASSVNVVATTTDPLAELFINSNTTSTLNGVPTTIPFSQGAFGADGSTYFVKVLAQDYSSTQYPIAIAATTTPDSALTFTSTNDSIGCPSTTPVHCTLTATSTKFLIPFDFTPTLTVPGGSMTINGAPWTSGTDYTSSTVQGGTSLTINVTGVDSSTSTYQISVSANYPYISGESDFGSFSQFNILNLTTIGSNAWATDNSGNLYEITPSGTVTEHVYGGTDPNPSPFGLVTDGTNLFMIGNEYPTSGIIEYMPGSNTWKTYNPPYANNTDGYFGGAVDKNGNIWAINWDDDSIMEMSPTGTFLGNFPNATTTSYLETYGAMAYDGTNMWAYSGNKYLTEFSPTGTILTSVNLTSGCYPSGATFDGTNIWVLDMCGTVNEISPSGTILKTLSTAGSNEGGIVFDGSNIWVMGRGYVTKIVPSSAQEYAYQYKQTNGYAAAYAAGTSMLWASGHGATTFSPNQPGSGPSTYSVTVTQGSNGTISPGTQASISSGSSQTFTITPSSGYEIATLTIDGSSVATSTSYTFSNITANHTITASFSAIPSSSSGGGSSAPIVVSVASGGGGGGGYIPPTQPSNPSSPAPSTSTAPTNTNTNTNTNTATSTASTTPSTIPPPAPSSTLANLTGITTSTTSTPPLPPTPHVPTSTKGKSDAYVFAVLNVVNGYGGVTLPSSFTLSVKGKGVSPSSFKGNNSGTMIALVPGSYSVIAHAYAGYSFAYTPDCKGFAASHNVATCVVTATQLQPPVLTVIQSVVNNAFGTALSSAFTVKVAGTRVSSSSFAGDAAGTIVSLAPGRYSVSEKTIPGYTLSYSKSCSGSVTYGAAPICTITATNPEVAHLFVLQNVVNAYGGTKIASNFSITVKGRSPSPSFFSGNASGTLVTLAPGAYTVFERAVAGYGITLSPECTGAAIAGQTIICTINTAELPPPTLTVIGSVVNSYFGTASSSNLALRVSGTRVTPSSFTGNASGTVISLAAGSYAVAATAPKGYTLTYSSACKGSVTYGSAPVCTVVASDPPVARLIVTEAVLNNYGGTKTAGSFSVSVRGVSVSPSFFSGNASGTVVTLKPGDYSVSQRAVAGYQTTLSPGCTGTIVAGEVVQCTIVAGDLPSPLLTVYAGTVSAYGGKAVPSNLTLTAHGTNVAPSTFSGSTAGTLVTLAPGSWSVSARSLTGYTLQYSGCSGRVTYGSNPVCTIIATQVKPRGWVPPPVVLPPTPTSTPTSTPVIPSSTTPTSTPSTPTSSTPITPTSTTAVPTSTPSTPTTTTTQLPISTAPLTPPSNGVTVDNGTSTVSTTTVVLNLPSSYIAPGTVSIANNGGAPGPTVSVPSGPYQWTLTPGDGVKTVTVFYTAPGSSSATASSTFQVFLDTGSDIIQQPQLDCTGLYLTGYAFANQPSDPTTVIRIQQFLNKYMGDDLAVTGIYDKATQDAVNQFQLEYNQEILAPWVPYGLPNSTTPTSNIYKTTQRWINVLACPGISLPTPKLP